MPADTKPIDLAGLRAAVARLRNAPFYPESAEDVQAVVGAAGALLDRVEALEAALGKLKAIQDRRDTPGYAASRHSTPDAAMRACGKELSDAVDEAIALLPPEAPRAGEAA